MACLLGIDNGLTVTKAVVFDEQGKALSVARRRLPQAMPRPRFIERNMDELWRETAAAIREALELSSRAASDIAAVAATAHGDGIYLLDRDLRPLGNGILSLDSRANEIVSAWDESGVSAQALAISGQQPHASAPSALLAWMKAHEPERFARIAHVLACKDWLRYCLTDEMGTDLTEASTSFTDVATQRFSQDALRVYGLEEISHTLPPVSLPHEVVGTVTKATAALTGLSAGTPVVAGIHDVVASALGVGGYASDTMAIIAGTYSINEIVSDAPATDPRWFCRNGIAHGQWNNMSISPASATNYDWFLDTLCAVERETADAERRSIHIEMAREIEATFERPSTLLFHPYLFGSPQGATASASFLGLRGWHNRGDMLRAVIEGVAFNHRVHVDALRERFAPRQARLTGGISRNPVFAQMFADALNLPVTVVQTEEPAAWGAALCAGAGVGLFTSPFDDPRDLENLAVTYSPDPVRADRLQRAYDLHCEVVRQLTPLWPRIESLGSEA